MKFLARFVDYGNEKSLGNKFRNKRFQLFEDRLNELDLKIIKILDVGGTQSFWENRGYAGRDDVEITLLNLHREPTDYSNIRSVVGDGVDLSRYNENEFDIAFSNSVIEHVFTWQRQMRMAKEIRRVGRFYYLQTPNRFFPVESHFLLPFFQFLPYKLKLFILTRTRLSLGRRTEWKKAKALVDEIRLLSRCELRRMFPESVLIPEKFLGFNKSFIVCFMKCSAKDYKLSK